MPEKQQTLRAKLALQVAGSSAAGGPSFTGTQRFTILRRIGEGGMGAVYEALDNELNQLVALKHLPNPDPFLILQFKREFRSLTEIVHPNILPLYELFAEHDQWFFTMELLENPVTLLAWIRDDSLHEEPSVESPPTVTTTVAFTPADDEPGDVMVKSPRRAKTRCTVSLDRLNQAFSQMAEGVAALHGHHKLHRDLKPENVLVRSSGRLALLDFGLIADLTATQSRSDEGGPAVPEAYYMTSRHLAGTIAYMSPEQAGGEALTPASDWYAVGVMLFQALTGKLPFAGSGKSVLSAKRHHCAPSPADFVDGIPGDLEKLCCALLRRDPAERPSGREVLSYFKPDLAHAPDSPDDSPAEPLFVGREAHMARLYQTFGRAVAGRPTACYVEGKSGVGKSALVQRFLSEVGNRPDILVLSARCHEQESVPYKAVDGLVDALSNRLVHLPAAQLSAFLPDDLAPLVRVFPVLRRLLPADAAPDQSAFLSLRELRTRAVASLGTLFARISQRFIIVLAIDDLQWGDVDSAGLLIELLCTPELRSLLLIASLRSEYREISQCLRLLEQTDRLDAVKRTTVDVDPLSEAETLELALKLLGDAASAATTAARIVQESQGSAFFVYELVRHARAGRELGPAAELQLDEILWQRVNTLPEDARLLLETVAVAGAPIRISEACRAGRAAGSARNLVAQLRVAHFIRKLGVGPDDQVETYHDRVRETVVNHLAAPVRRDYHSRLAETLSASPAAEPETVAGHYQGAGDPRAAAYYEAAAARALERLAFDRAERYFKLAAELAPSDSARTRVYEKMIHFYTDTARFQDAYDIGCRAVSMLGVRLPKKFNPPALIADCAAAWLRTTRLGIPEILNLPEMRQDDCRDVVRLISAVAKAAYQIRPELCVAVSAKAVNLCLKRGNIGDAAVPYMVFGCIFVGGVLGRYRTGHAFGKLALNLVEKYGNRPQHAEVHFVVGYFGTSWLQPAIEAERLWAVARSSGVEVNDLFHTGCACAATIQSYFMRGVPLDRIWDESEAMIDFLTRVQLREPLGCILSVRHAIRNLRGETDPDFDEAAFAAEVAHFGSKHFAHFCFVNRMTVLFLRGEFEAAREAARTSAEYVNQGLLQTAEHVFYNALIAASPAAPDGAPARGAQRELARAERQYRKWAALCPDNFEHKALALSAERARLSGRHARAAELYSQAISSAERCECWQIAALANHLAALNQTQMRNPAAAADHRAASRGHWLRWGALALASE